ncbi:polyamine aminopropyltransferase [Vampirovibrio sp.]|uniref:polyamine aminopropyltransferase n=1 Tax=Vampirovibrio sp. TaxID=2717857 RepID=UPI0035948F92
MDLWVRERFQDRTELGYKVSSVLHHSVSDFQEVDVVDTVALGRMLFLDGMVMTSERDEFIYHEMIAHIPMLAHPNPKNVLVIGGGDGGTIREVLKHPSVARAVLCEIDGEVIEVCKKYLPSIAGKLDDPKVEIEVRDGAAYIAEHPNTFDVILIDSTDPIGPGEKLFTQEFYTHVLAALTENGIMACQSESPVAVPDECIRINRLLKSVFPYVQPYTACIPSYPGGQWTWSFCSKGLKPLENINAPVASELEKTCRFYNQEIHKTVFVLPNYVKAIFNPEPAGVAG